MVQSARGGGDRRLPIVWWRGGPPHSQPIETDHHGDTAPLDRHRRVRGYGEPAGGKNFTHTGVGAAVTTPDGFKRPLPPSIRHNKSVSVS